jgi:WD40 repeat protein
MDVRPRLTLNPLVWDGTRFSDSASLDHKQVSEHLPEVVGFTADGRLLVTCSLDSWCAKSPHQHLQAIVQAWDTTCGKEKGQWILSPGPELDEHTGISPALSPDRDHFILTYLTPGSTQQSLRLLSLKGGQQRSWLTRHFHFAPDGQLLALVTINEQGREELKIIDPIRDEEIAVVAHDFRKNTEGTAFDNITFLSDGRTLSFSVERHAKLRRNHGRRRNRTKLTTQVILWDVPTRQPRLTVDTGTATVAFAPDGKTMAAINDGLKLWSTATGRLVAWKDLKPVGEFHELRFSRDSSILTAISTDVTLPHGTEYHTQLAGFASRTLSLLWSRKTRTTPETIFDEFDDPSSSLLPQYIQYRHMQVKKDGKGGQYAEGSGRVTIVDTLTGQEQLALPEEDNRDKWRPWNGKSELSPDRRLFVLSQLGHKRELIREWIARLVPRLQAPTDEEESWIRCWDLITGREYPSLPRCGDDFSFSPGGGTLATLGNDGTVKLWDLPPRKPFGLILAWSSVSAGLVLLLAWRRGRRLET